MLGLMQDQALLISTLIDRRVEFARFADLLHFIRMDLSRPEDYARLAASLRERNADIVGVHLARFAIIPFMLLGPLVGALVLRLRGRAVLRRWLAVGWLVLAIAGAYPFSYFLRFYF